MCGKLDNVIIKVAKWIVSKAKSFIGKLTGKKDDKPDERTPQQKADDLKNAVADAKALDKSQKKASVLAKALDKIKKKYRLTDLTAKQGEKGFDVHAAVNPEVTFQLDADDDDRLAKAIGAKAAPKIDALPGSAKIAAVKDALSESLKEACAELRIDTKGKNLEYEKAETGEGMPIEHVILFNSGTKTRIGAIWNPKDLFEEIDNPVEGPAKTFRNRVTKDLFVHDAKQQYVQRYVIRNLSDQDLKTMRSKAGEKGEVKGPIKPTGPRHRTTPQEHVMGVKPSPFISTTKTPGGQIVNEKGESFVSGEQARIDLCYIRSRSIFDLSTRVGQDEWGLSYPTTEKAKQALKDVIRTQEVLIKSEIPAEALLKI